MSKYVNRMHTENLEVEEGVAPLTLNRQMKLLAVSPASTLEIQNVLKAAEQGAGGKVLMRSSSGESTAKRSINQHVVLQSRCERIEALITSCYSGRI